MNSAIADRYAARRLSEALSSIRQVTKILALWVVICTAACSAEYDRIYRGEYVWGAEVHSFRPCASEEAFWVSASSWVIGPVREFYESETEVAYTPIYIEFRGHLLDETTEGFAASYAGLIRISEVLRVSAEVPQECR